MISSKCDVRHVCMVVYNPYENDNRVRRYAESLARSGDKVTVFSLAAPDEPLAPRQLNGVTVVPILCAARNRTGKLGYILDYWRFWWKAFRALRPSDFRGGCQVVHVHNMPDALVFAALRLKWKGSKIVFDIHDLMPELYQEKFSLSASHPIPRLLRWVERQACRFADHVIVSNDLWKETISNRSRTDDGEVSAIINHVDLKVFTRRVRSRDAGKFVILYAGSLGRHQGLDIAVDAMVRVRKEEPETELHIYGFGPELAKLRDQADRLNLGETVRIRTGVRFSEVADLIVNADLGVVPKRADGFGNEAYSTKIMEFMSQEIPVVVSRTKIDSFYFDDDCVCFFESGNAVDLANRIISLARNPERRKRLAANAFKLVRQTSWEAVEGKYLGLVERLAPTKRRVTSGIPESSVVIELAG